MVWWNTGRHQGGRQEPASKWMKKTEGVYCRVGGGDNCAMKWCVLSGLSAEQRQREEMEEESLGKTEKCGDDEEAKEKHNSSPCKNVSLAAVPCTLPLPVLCFLTCVWFCVGVTFCFMLRVFSCRVPHSIPLAFFLSCSSCLPHLGQRAFTNTSCWLFYPTPSGHLGNCIRVKWIKRADPMQRNLPIWRFKWDETKSYKSLFGQGLVCTCAGHTNCDVPLSSWSLSWLAAVLWFELWHPLMTHGLISFQRLVVSEDWAASEDFCRLFPCVWVTETESNRYVCHIVALCSRCPCMLARLELGGGVFPLLQWCVWPILSLSWCILLF